MKEQLIFDPTLPNESDNLGVYLRSSDGTLLTHTTLGGKERLDTIAALLDGSGNAIGSVSGQLSVNDASANTALSSIDGKITTTVNGIKVDGSAVTQPISAVSLPLPTGAATEATLASIDSKLNTLGQKTSANSVPVVISSDQPSINVNAVISPSSSGILMAGTEDGLPTGTIRYLVNNLRKQILDTHDRGQAITYADFGTKNQRITQVDYTSPTILGFTARKSIAYSLVGNKYRRDSITWSIV